MSTPPMQGFFLHVCPINTQFFPMVPPPSLSTPVWIFREWILQKKFIRSPHPPSKLEDINLCRSFCCKFHICVVQVSKVLIISWKPHPIPNTLGGVCLLNHYFLEVTEFKSTYRHKYTYRYIHVQTQYFKGMCFRWKNHSNADFIYKCMYLIPLSHRHRITESHRQNFRTVLNGSTLHSSLNRSVISERP